MKVKSEDYAFPAEVLQSLMEKEDEELTHEQKIALENLQRHCKIQDLDTLEELYEEFSEIESLKDKHIYKLLEVVPQHESTVRSVFQKERVKLDESEIEQILDLCQSIELE